MSELNDIEIQGQLLVVRKLDKCEIKLNKKRTYSGLTPLSRPIGESDFLVTFDVTLNKLKVTVRKAFNPLS